MNKLEAISPEVKTLLSDLMFQVEHENNSETKHKARVLTNRINNAIDYIYQVIKYKDAAKEIDNEIDTLVDILKGE